MNNDINFDDNEDEDNDNTDLLEASRSRISLNDNYQEQRTLEAHEIVDQENQRPKPMFGLPDLPEE